MDLAGGDDIAGVLLILAGQLGGAAGGRYTKAATLDTATLILPPKLQIRNLKLYTTL